MGTFTDPRDGKTYKTVKIGNQTWMAENLNYDAPGSKYYDNNPDNGQKYGRLYDWETAKKACPPGWHLPSYGEWEKLENFAGGREIAGEKFKASRGWDGTDEYGFSALPGGSYSSTGQWWTRTDCKYAGYGDNKAWTRWMCSNSKDFSWMSVFESSLCSVRCVQDEWIFWSIFRIVLGGTIGGFAFAFLSVEAADSREAADIIGSLATVIGILFFIIGCLNDGCGGGIVGGIVGIIIGVILGALFINIPFIASIALGVSIGALIGWKKLYSEL